jgi:fido (protein-threonine AMPylation protein)
MNLAVKIPGLSKVDEKLDAIRQLTQYDPLLLLIKDKFQTDVTQHLTSLKSKNDRSVSEIIRLKDHNYESLKQAYLSYGKERAVTQFIFDISGQMLSVRNILLLAEILLGVTTFRQKEIFITNINGDRQRTPSHEQVGQEMEKLVDWYNGAVKDKADHPVTIATILHYRLTTIHPFDDWNGRIARLMLNVALMQHGYLPVLIGPEDRLVYYENLEKADKGSTESLVGFIANRELKAVDAFMSSPEYLSIQGKYEMEKQTHKLGDNEKCIVLTEDSATDNLLALLLEASGFRMDETNIISYEGCSKISSANLFSIFVKEKMPNVKIVVHRDRDYLTDAEIDIQRVSFQKIDTHFFVTKGTDIESYFLNSRHVSFCHPKVDEHTAQRIVDDSINEVFPKSVDYLRKKEFGGNKPELFSHLNQALDELVRNNLRRFVHGKTAYRILQYKIQDVAHEKADLEKASPFLMVKQLNKIANSIWGNQEPM